jgi:hypothetical protein
MITQTGSASTAKRRITIMNFLHLREEHGLSRRRFLRTAAGLTGGVIASRLLFPTWAWAQRLADPKPIPGGTTVVIGNESFFIHAFPPASENEPSEITDFEGYVGKCRVLGTGTGTNTDTGEQMSLLHRTDLGFMKGTYVGTDGKHHHGTFNFV